jgi:hypothetical protein
MGDADALVVDADSERSDGTVYLKAGLGAEGIAGGDAVVNVYDHFRGSARLHEGDKNRARGKQAQGEQTVQKGKGPERTG